MPLKNRAEIIGISKTAALSPIDMKPHFRTADFKLPRVNIADTNRDRSITILVTKSSSLLLAFLLIYFLYISLVIIVANPKAIPEPVPNRAINKVAKIPPPIKEGM